MGARGQRERGGVPGVSSFCPNREGPTTFHPVSHTRKPELVDLKFVGDDGDRDKGCDIGMQQGMRYVDNGHRDSEPQHSVHTAAFPPRISLRVISFTRILAPLSLSLSCSVPPSHSLSLSLISPGLKGIRDDGVPLAMDRRAQLRLHLHISLSEPSPVPSLTICIFLSLTHSLSLSLSISLSHTHTHSLSFSIALLFSLPLFR